MKDLSTDGMRNKEKLNKNRTQFIQDGGRCSNVNFTTTIRMFYFLLKKKAKTHQVQVFSHSLGPECLLLIFLWLDRLTSPTCDYLVSKWINTWDKNNHIWHVWWHQPVTNTWQWNDVPAAPQMVCPSGWVVTSSYIHTVQDGNSVHSQSDLSNRDGRSRTQLFGLFSFRDWW